jgi:hypothetical protein
MISRTKIKNTIDEAEEDFRKCWAFLKRMKVFDSSPLTANEILGFQPQLAEAIF